MAWLHWRHLLLCTPHPQHEIQEEALKRLLRVTFGWNSLRLLQRTTPNGRRNFPSFFPSRGNIMAM